MWNGSRVSPDTGQAAAVDNLLMLDLLTAAAARVNPNAESVLDIGCGAGNFSLNLLRKIPNLQVTLVDLSHPMLDRARERIRRQTSGKVRTVQADIREIPLEERSFDIILAAAVLHHLRSEGEWEVVFKKVHNALKPGGSFWICDLVEHEDARVQGLFWEHYGKFLLAQGGSELRDHVFEYIAKEDTPRSLTYQMGVLHQVGFAAVDVIHKSCCFAAFGGIKAGSGN